MSQHLRFCVALLLICLLTASRLMAQEAPSDVVQFSQPIPVVIRMANNAVIQTMLVGMDQNGISTVTVQGRVVEYTFKKIRSVRSQDGSLFFAPAKDNMAELIDRLSKLNPPAASPNAGGFSGSGVAGSTAPANNFGGAQPGFGHGQTMPSQPGFNSGSSPAQMMAHAQANTQSAYNPPPSNPMPSSSNSHMQTPFNNFPPPSGMPHMPMGAHSQAPPAGPMSMPGMNSHNQMSNMGQPNMGQQMVWQYECTKCHHKFTSPTEVKAGHRCTKCGIVWGEIQDENGRTLSSSPAAKIGGGIGFLFAIIGIIVAIVRKVQSA